MWLSNFIHDWFDFPCTGFHSSLLCIFLYSAFSFLYVFANVTTSDQIKFITRPLKIIPNDSKVLLYWFTLYTCVLHNKKFESVNRFEDIWIEQAASIVVVMLYVALLCH